jgi:hypothetical protein
MKKFIIALAAPIILFCAGCGHSSDEGESTENLNEIKIVILGDSLSIMVPDTITGQKEIKEQAWGAIEIKIGTKFQISIEQNEGDIELQKSDIEGNDVYKFQRYIKNEQALLFWESKIPEMEQSNFHFYTIRKAGNNTYLIKDIDSGDTYSENDVQVMIDAAERLKVKEPATTKPNS